MKGQAFQAERQRQRRGGMTFRAQSRRRGNRSRCAWKWWKVAVKLRKCRHIQGWQVTAEPRASDICPSWSLRAGKGAGWNRSLWAPMISHQGEQRAGPKFTDPGKVLECSLCSASCGYRPSTPTASAAPPGGPELQMCRVIESFLHTTACTFPLGTLPLACASCHEMCVLKCICANECIESVHVHLKYAKGYLCLCVHTHKQNICLRCLC